MGLTGSFDMENQSVEIGGVAFVKEANVRN